MKTLSQMYNEIQPLIDNGWNVAAAAALEQLLTGHPDFGQGYHDLGTLYLENNESEKAGKSFQKAVDCDPENQTYLRSLADFHHVEMEDIDRALSLYKRLIDTGYANTEVFFITANLSLVSKQIEQALHYYEKVLELEPWHSEAFDYAEKIKAHLSKKSVNAENARHPHQDANFSIEDLYASATELANAGKNREAVEILRKLIGLAPDTPAAHNDLGVLYHRLGDTEKSILHYQTATKLEPSNATFHKNLADFLSFEQGNVVEGLKIYLKLLEENPEDVEVLMAAGVISQAIGRLPDAELFFDRVLDIEPWNFEASEKLDELRRTVDA